MATTQEHAAQHAQMPAPQDAAALPPSTRPSSRRTPARVFAPVPTFRSAMGRQQAPLRLWVTELTQRGIVVSDGEGAAVWVIDERSRHAVEQALALGIRAVDVHADGTAVIAGSELIIAPW